MIKVILFDIDDTLLDFDKCARSSIFIACKKYKVDYTEELIRVFMQTTSLLFEKIENGTMSRDEMKNLRWQIIFDKLDIKDIDPVEFEMCFREDLIKSYIEVDGALELLKYLDGKYDLYCASNAPSGQQEYRLESAGMLKYFKKIFVSGDINLYKPNKEFFDYCMSFFTNVKNNEVLMVGDNIRSDINGAINYGLKTCFFNKYKEAINVDSTYTITSLLELKNIL